MVLFDFDLLEQAEASSDIAAAAAPPPPSSVEALDGAAAGPRADEAAEAIGLEPGAATAPEAALAAGTGERRPGGGESDAADAGNGASQGQPSTDPLDEVQWHSVVAAPSAGTLAKWVRSEPVREVLRQFVLEDAFGEADAIRFNEVYRLLEILSLTPAAFVAKFAAKVPTRTEEVDALADRILARFAAPGSSSLRFRELFHMLEVVGVSMYKLLSNFVEDVSTLQVLLEVQVLFYPYLRLGSFLVSREIGAGFRGPCCYLAEHASTRQRAAVKWPVPQFELAMWQEIHKRALTQPGLPRVLACGYFEGERYVVTELLGSPLSKVFGRLQDHPLEKRWAALRVIGRLVLRRLKAVHGLGLVHNDVSPENVLLGRARLTPTAASKHTMYLVDFGLVRRSGTALQGNEGSAEWSSVRSADGGARYPYDDLEALGWVLVYGLFGDLPWCERLTETYERWHLVAARETVLRGVRDGKLQLLQGGWNSDSGRWRVLADVPKELDEYLRLAAQLTNAKAPDAIPDYAELLRLLGDSAGGSCGCLEVEERDLKDYVTFVDPLL